MKARPVVLFTTLACCVSNASAGDFYENGLTARALAIAGAAAASCDSGLDAMELNPAALGCVKRRSLELNVTGILASGQFTNAWNANGRLASGAGVLPYGAVTIPLGWKGIVTGFPSLRNFSPRPNGTISMRPAGGAAKHHMAIRSRNPPSWA